jgi:DNA adenine methylase
MKKQNYIRPVIGRTGSKYSLLKEIIPIIPDHLIYVELFAGSAVVWLNKPLVDTNVINDLDPCIKEGFDLIKEASADISKYRQFGDKYDPVVFEKIRDFYYNHIPTTPEDKLHFFKIRQNGGFTGKPVRKKNNISKWGCPQITKYHQKAFTRTKEYLNNTNVFNEDYYEIIKKYDSPDTFFFIDPPYKMKSYSDFGYAEYKEFDFDRLFNAISNLEGKFILTINDIPELREQYKDYNIKPVEVKCHVIHTIRKELIITKY